MYDKDQEKDPDKELRLAIGRCIGEIGPVDFYSLALQVAEGESFSNEIQWNLFVFFFQFLAINVLKGVCILFSVLLNHLDIELVQR